MMTEEQLRAQLAERLGQESVSNVHWELLEYRGHVKDALDIGSKAAIEDLVEAARALREYAELMEGVAPSKERMKARHKRRSREHRAPEVDDDEARYAVERAATLGEYLSLRASLHPDVRRFRDKVLEGKLLTPQEAQAFIESPANSRFSPDYLKEKGVPLVRHSARFLEHGTRPEGDNSERFVEFESIHIDPPGDTFVAQLPVSVAFDDLAKVRLPADTQQIAGGEPYSRMVPIDEYAYVSVYPGSVLDYLGWLGLRLSEHFCSAWDEAQAAWFVLTGENSLPRSMAGHYDSATGEDLTYGTITLTVEPWAPANAVARFYQHLQQDVLGQRSRAPSLRNLAVFRFVTSELKDSLVNAGELEDIEHLPPWPEFKRRWNAMNRSKPSWTYKHLSKFQRDYYRGGRAIVEPYDHNELFPPYKWSIP
jgi:hypothetical protein